MLEWAGVLTWQHRITRIRERCTDLFGRISWRWRVIRTSNAYVFRDPKCSRSPPALLPSPKIRREHRIKIFLILYRPGHAIPTGSLERALARFGAAVAARKGIEQGAGSPAGAS